MVVKISSLTKYLQSSSSFFFFFACALHAWMQPGFGVRRGEKKNHNETTNKHPFNINKLLTKLFLRREKKKLLTKKKTGNHCFLTQYNYL